MLVRVHELATGEALEHQPRAVLEIVGPEIGIKSVCGGPDIDDSGTYDSYNLSIKAIEKGKRVLRTVSDPQLIAVRDQCIREHRTAQQLRSWVPVALPTPAAGDFCR
jgi:hypothetical protein